MAETASIAEASTLQDPIDAQGASPEEKFTKTQCAKRIK